MNKAILALALLAASGVVRADDPYVGYIFPAGIQAGTTNRFLLGGQFLNGVKGLRFSGDDALRVLKIEVVPGFPVPTGPQRRHLKTWLDGIQEGYLLDAICDVAAEMDLPASKLQLLQDRLPEREFLKTE